MTESSIHYRERLLPAVWVFLATALIIPGTLLVFLPISWSAGVVIAAVLYAGICLLLLCTTPTIQVGNTELHAGVAKLPLDVITNVRVITGAEATLERGTKLHADAWLLIRGWIPHLVRIELNDPQDPTPYWLISSRHPKSLADAIRTAQEKLPG